MKVSNTFNSPSIIRKVTLAIELYGSTEAVRLEAYAKANRKWIDRTSNAKNSIQGKFKWEKGQAVIELSGNMSYSSSLELANEKKYAILKPTIERFQKDILSGYKKVVE